MQLEPFKTGIILKTERYQECLMFYSEILSLKVIFDKTEGDFAMSELAFGNSYLLIETGGQYSPLPKGVDKNPIIIRFDVADVTQVLVLFESHGIQAEYYTFDWGKIVLVYDPDGNPIEFKSEP
ncbi:VOC family protein [Photobacterium piscicola]|uniref:VOC family protein n=1 Tax=Photobacterium piscicola TaxID=1378299 RepID=UPI003735A13E